MKKIVCELCDGMEFTKVDGMFVCNSCGTKYSTEEAKAMMKEIDDGGVASVTPTAQAPVQSSEQTQKQLENILVLATTAYEAENYQEAENYCNRAIEIDATSYKAWFLKGKAVGWSSKLDNMRVEEAAHSFCKALDFAPESEKSELKDEAVTVLKDLGIAAISLRKKRFAQSPDDEELAGFSKDRKALIDALLVLLKHGNLVEIPEDYLKRIASMMNDAAVDALNNSRDKWKKVDYPTDKDLTTYLGWIGNCEQLLRQAIDVCKDDDAEDITRYKNLIVVLEDPIDRWSYQQEWSSYSSSYIHTKSKSLSDNAVKIRRKQVQECKDAIAKIEKSIKEKKEAEMRKAAEEKKARIDAYWSQHSEEKAALDEEMETLKKEKQEIEDQLTAYRGEQTVTKRNGNEKGPIELEQDALYKQISDLQLEKSQLGLFKGKEKKEIDLKIDGLRGQALELDPQVISEKDARKKATQAKLDELSEKMKPLEERKSELISRIQEITVELEMDR